MTTATGSPKLASVVAERIVDDVAALGWPEGEVVGSEPELLDRYGVSRAVLREAVRVLEHRHVARMRRGPGGGLVVMSPSVESATDAVCVHLVYERAGIDQVIDARLVLEELAAGLAAERVDPGGRRTLHALIGREADGEVRDHRALHNLVAAQSGNPALAFFVDLLNRVTLRYILTTARLSKGSAAASLEAHAAIVRAVEEGDAVAARRRMRKHLLAEAELLRGRRPSAKRLAELASAAERSGKRAEVTAMAIFGAVVKRGWPVGELLGSEADLMARYDVSRAVLREAVRVLEHHQVVRMRRGPGGGLFVIEPGDGAIVDEIGLQVDRLGITVAHLAEIRDALDRAVAVAPSNRVLALLGEVVADVRRAPLG